MYQYAAVRMADSLTGECKTAGVFFYDPSSCTPSVYSRFFHRDPDPILQAVIDDIVQSIKTPADLCSQSVRSGIPFVGLWLTSVKPSELDPHEFLKLDLDAEFSSWDSR